MNLEKLSAWNPDSGLLTVVVETPKGSRSKLAYNPKQGLFELGKVLPRGMAFPFDFGFVPSTVAADGDPIDVLLLFNEPLPTGCKVLARLIGVIEAEHVKAGELPVRNDRLVAVADASRDHDGVHALKDLGDRLAEEIEHFFVAYHELSGSRFRPLGRRGPNHAARLVKEAAKRFHHRTHAEEEHSA